LIVLYDARESDKRIAINHESTKKLTDMIITRENYQAFFLDYHEGNLTSGQIAELMDFLVENPDLKEEFDEIDLVYLQDPNPDVFSHKDDLKMPLDAAIGGPIGDRHLIAWHEGDLNQEEQKMVLEAISEDSNLERDFNLFGLAKIQPDLTITFKGKSSLKRFVLGFQPGIIRNFAAAAAVLAILSTIYFMLPDINPSYELAEVNPIASPADSLSREILNVQKEPDPVIQPADNSTEPQGSEQPVSRRSGITEPGFSYRSKSFQLASVDPLPTLPVQITGNKPEFIETRQEFYWVSLAMDYSDEEIEQDMLPIETAPARRYSSFASLAYEGIERTTGVDVQRIERQIAERNFGIWDLAGLGLAGINQLTGTSLTLEKETDENGRIRTFGIGERFRISR